MIIVRLNDYIKKNDFLLSKQMRIRRKRFIDINLKIIINAIHII